MKKSEIFTFKKENNKWKCYISGKVAFYWFSTYGFPLELFNEEVNKLPLNIKLENAINCWLKKEEEMKINCSPSHLSKL